MTIKLVNMGNSAELLLEGRLDSSNAEEVEKLMMQAAERFENLILNFYKLEYISSAGLRVLKKLHITMKQNGGQLTIKYANKMVMEVFEMTGFVGLLRFE